MTASDLREWIAIFMMDLVPDGAGGDREAVPLGLVADRPAKVSTPTPRTVFAGDQRADRVQFLVTIRYEPGVTTNYRVMWRDQLLDVVGVKNLEDERDTWLELTCERYEAGKQ
jgi:head-tail adaptor